MATLKDIGRVRMRLRIGGRDLQETLRATQGDTAQVWEWEVLDTNGVAVTDLDGVVPMLYVRRPNGDGVGSTQGTITNGIVRFDVPSGLLSEPGETEAQILLEHAGRKEKLHDETYKLEIARSLEAGAIPAENVWFRLSELLAAIETVHALEAAYDNDVAAIETMRDDVTEKHGEVVTIHAQLSDTLQAELARRAAEEARDAAERARDQAETARAGNEVARNMDAAAQATAAQAQADAEQERVENERERNNAEQARANAAQAQATAEEGRVTAEEGRVNAETDRKTRFDGWAGILDGTADAQQDQRLDALEAVGRMADKPIVTPKNGDFNDWKTPGFYFNRANVDVVTQANRPTDSAYTMVILRTAGIVQIVVEYAQSNDGKNKMFVRGFYDLGNWSPWWEVASTQELSAKIEELRAVMESKTLWKTGLISSGKAGQLLRTGANAGGGTWFVKIERLYYNEQRMDVFRGRLNYSATTAYPQIVPIGGTAPVEMTLAVVDGKLCLWLPSNGKQLRTYAYIQEVSVDGGNKQLVEDIVDAEKPVTEILTFTAAQSASHFATTEKAGLMSASDKIKLNGALSATQASADYQTKPVLLNAAPTGTPSSNGHDNGTLILVRGS